MNEIILPAAVLRDALTGALAAVATDKNLPAFNCIKVTATPLGIDIVATNRYLLVCGTVTPSNDYDAWRDFDALIHVDDVKLIISELKAALRINKNMGVKLVHDGHAVTLHGIPDVTVTAKDLSRQHDFPKYAQLWPVNYGVVQTIGIDPDMFAKLAKIPARKDTPVKLQFVGENRAIRVHVDHETITWQVIIMPIRIDK